MFNRNKFKANVVLAGLTMQTVADDLGIHLSTLYRKLENNGDFSRTEMLKLKKILHIENPADIFFDEELTETQ